MDVKKLQIKGPKAHSNHLHSQGMLLQNQKYLNDPQGEIAEHLEDYIEIGLNLDLNMLLVKVCFQHEQPISDRDDFQSS